jgi:hypothetical protein
MVEKAHTHEHNVLTVGTVCTKMLASKIKEESYWVLSLGCLISCCHFSLTKASAPVLLRSKIVGILTQIAFGNLNESKEKAE